MRIVCDTNVLVSGILFGGNARAIVRLVSRGHVTNVISTRVLEECEEVLMRPKFGLSRQHVVGILSLFRDTFETVIPSHSVTAVAADPDDNRVLEAAIEGGCEVIVSGDGHLLELGEWEGIRILSPTDFLEHYGRT